MEFILYKILAIIWHSYCIKYGHLYGIIFRLCTNGIATAIIIVISVDRYMIGIIRDHLEMFGMLVKNCKVYDGRVYMLMKNCKAYNGHSRWG